MTNEKNHTDENTEVPELKIDADWARKRYMKNQRDEELFDVLEEALRFPVSDNERAVPALFSRQKETRGIMVSAPSGEGKTTLLERNLSDLPGLGFYDGKEGNVVTVTVPPDGTLKGLAAAILGETGYKVDQKKLQVAEAWEMVRHRMSLLNISVLWIDEAHHLLTSGPGRDAAIALRRLKSMLQGEEALVVVLSGVPILADQLRKDEETNRRFFKLALGPVRTAEDRVKLQRFIDALCHTTGVGAVADPDIVDRLLAATGSSLGAAIDLVTRCLARALEKGYAKLELRHFRRAYRISGSAGSITPFDDEPWNTLGPALEELEAGAA